jgi:hypothetical protein
MAKYNYAYAGQSTPATPPNNPWPGFVVMLTILAIIFIALGLPVFHYSPWWIAAPIPALVLVFLLALTTILGIRAFGTLKKSR